LTLQHAHTSLFGNSAEEVKPEFPFLAGRANIVPRSNNLYCTNKAVYFALVLRGVTQWESSFRRQVSSPRLLGVSALVSRVISPAEQPSRPRLSSKVAHLPAQMCVASSGKLLTSPSESCGKSLMRCGRSTTVASLQVGCACTSTVYCSPTIGPPNQEVLRYSSFFGARAHTHRPGVLL